jgi:hypothetical protein
MLAVDLATPVAAMMARRDTHCRPGWAELTASWSTKA